MLTMPELRELLTYCPLTGHFRYRRASGKNKVGAIAGRVRADGYREIKLKGKCYLAHRLAWLYVRGSMPPEVDHENHVRDDNRWQNLRAADDSENQRNRSLNKNNSSGHTGVHWNKHAKKWRAMISIDGKQTLIGYYTEKDDAIAARKAAEQEHGFHRNHGVSA